MPAFLTGVAATAAPIASALHLLLLPALLSPSKPYVWLRLLKHVDRHLRSQYRPKTREAIWRRDKRRAQMKRGRRQVRRCCACAARDRGTDFLRRCGSRLFGEGANPLLLSMPNNKEQQQLQRSLSRSGRSGLSSTFSLAPPPVTASHCLGRAIGRDAARCAIASPSSRARAVPGQVHIVE